MKIYNYRNVLIMKKFINVTLTILTLIVALSLVGCGLGYDVPIRDAYELTGDDGAGISGTPALSFNGFVTKNSDNPIPLSDVVFNEANDVLWDKEYYTTTLSLSPDENGKMVVRTSTRTYVNVITNSATRPSNWDDFMYISSAMPKDIYEVDYQYTLGRKSNVGSPGNSTTPFDLVERGTSWINLKLFDFIRYVYLQTEGKVLLSVTYDTSFNYQTNDFGGGIAIRAKMTVVDSNLIGSYTLNDVFEARCMQDSLLGTFNSTGHRLGIKLINDVALADGASTWCDMQISVPNMVTGAEGLWTYMLYYYNQI